MNEKTMPEIGSLWKRKQGRFFWEVTDTEPAFGGGVAVALHLRGLELPEVEMHSLEYFLEHFEPADGCPACAGDVTFPHSADCAYAPGN